MSLDDILVTPLKRIATDGGDVMHAIKKSEKGFEGFGEAYFSWVEGGAMQSFVTSAITGTNGPALFLTVTYADWDSWGAAVSHTRGSELMRSLRESSNSAATVMANIQLATL